MIQVLRPSLRQSTSSILKIQYSAKVEEVDGISAISGEIIRVTRLEVVLPFAGKLEKSRQDREFYTPSEAEIDQLREQWHRLAPPERAIFVGGEHRIVAAEQYDLALRKDDSLRGTLFAIISTLKGNPVTGGAPPSRPRRVSLTLGRQRRIRWRQFWRPGVNECRNCGHGAQFLAPESSNP